MLLLVAVAMSFSACEDFEDDNLDFSNSLAQYVELTSGSAIETEAGAVVDVTVRMREAINVPVTIGYDVSGDFSSTGTVIIDGGALSATISLTVPVDPTTGVAKVQLTSVDNNLALGRGGPDAGLSAVARDLSW